MPEVVIPLTVDPWFWGLVAEVELMDCDETWSTCGVSQGVLV